MRRSFLSLLIAGLIFLPLAVHGQGVSACDLNQDGRTDAADVQLAVNMALGLSPCTANIAGSGVCSVVTTQRVTNAAIGGTCVTSGSHAVTLSWGASPSTNVAGYHVYRAVTSGGPYTRVNAAAVNTTSYADSSVQGGQTYFYVATAVANTSVESAYSNEARAAVPAP